MNEKRWQLICRSFMVLTVWFVFHETLSEKISETLAKSTAPQLCRLFPKYSTPFLRGCSENQQKLEGHFSGGVTCVFIKKLFNGIFDAFLILSLLFLWSKIQLRHAFIIGVSSLFVIPLINLFCLLWPSLTTASAPRGIARVWYLHAPWIFKGLVFGGGATLLLRKLKSPQTAMTILLLAFSLFGILAPVQSWAACTAVMTNQCAQGPTQQYTTNGVYYRNSSCSQACACQIADDTCPGCAEQTSGVPNDCFTNAGALCSDPCTELPQLGSLPSWLMAMGLSGIVMYLFRRRKSGT